MKYSIIIALMMTACGREYPNNPAIPEKAPACANSSLVGNWIINSGGTITMKNDCSFTLEVNGCVKTGTFIDGLTVVYPDAGYFLYLSVQIDNCDAGKNNTYEKAIYNKTGKTLDLTF